MLLPMAVEPPDALAVRGRKCTEGNPACLLSTHAFRGHGGEQLREIARVEVAGCGEWLAEHQCDRLLRHPTRCSLRVDQHEQGAQGDEPQHDLRTSHASRSKW